MSDPGVKLDSTPTVHKADGSRETLVRGHDIEVSPGTMVGRYVLFECVGAGSGGAVFRAFDPELSRYLGIKLLQSPGGTAAEVNRWRAKVMREAQALAQFNHPNVVAVHDVGVSGGRVFIAMELVEGRSLREWLAETQPSTHQILDAFLQAGEALAAAHEAGMVHRDFKPGNAAMGDDGRVRVLDFGLAKGIAEPEAGEEPSASGDRQRRNLTSSLLDTPLTVRGAVAGTPVYMAPEQLRAERVDARSDQFAYCVALFEALGGERPFTGTRVVDLRRQKTLGQIDLEAAKRVPRRLRKIVLRGLAPHPDDRYPDMRALLAAIDRTQGRPGPVLAAAGMVVALGLGIASYAVTNPPPPDPCAAAKAPIDLWTAERRATVSGAFVATGAPDVDAQLTHLDELFATLSTNLSVAQVEVCEATHVRKVQSEALMDARGLCLDRARGRLDTLVEAFERRATPKLVADAYAMASEVGDISECSDLERLDSDMAATEASGASPERVASIESRMDRADIMRKTGERDGSAQLLHTLLEESTELGYDRGAARAKLLMASNANTRGEGEKARQLLEEALRLTGQAHTHHLSAKIWVLLLDVTGGTLADLRGAETVALAADHAVRVAGDPPDLRGELEVVRGSMALQVGDLDVALAHLLIDERMQIELHGAEHYRTARAYSNVGGLLLETGDVEGALARLEHALRILERDGGETYTMSSTLINLGLLYSRNGDWTEAESTLARALQIEERLAGPDSASLRWPLNGLGLAKLRLGKVDEARELLTRAKDIQEATLGPDHPAIANNLANLADVAVVEGNVEKAEALLTQAHALLVNDAASTLDLVGIDMRLLRFQIDRGTCEGLDRLQSMRDLTASERGETHSEIAEIDQVMSECHTVRGEFDMAIEAAERANTALASSLDQSVLANAEFLLARTLQRRGTDADLQRARALATGAAGRLEPRAGEFASAQELAAVRSWLAAL